jgi:hypothetical protein
VFSVFYSAVGGEYRRVKSLVRLRFRPAVGGEWWWSTRRQDEYAHIVIFLFAIPWFLNADSLSIVYDSRRTVCGYGRKIVVYGVIVVLLTRF